MIRVRLRIGNGDIKDTFDAYGFVYVSSDSIMAPPTKGFESSSYPEEEGEHIIPKTVDAAFDYKVKFCVLAEGDLNNANKKIASFNEDLLLDDTSDTKTFNLVEFYNDYKKVKIVGYPNPISKAEDFWRDGKGETLKDAVVFEWTIRVNKPSLCNFNL